MYFEHRFNKNPLLHSFSFKRFCRLNKRSEVQNNYIFIKMKIFVNDASTWLCGTFRIRKPMCASDGYKLLLVEYLGAGI